MNALTKHFQERILLLLSDYVRNPSGENISKLSLGMNSSMVLENLDIREDLLLMNSIPLVINEGKINRIQITVPTLYKTMPARIDVENVMIRVRLLVEQRSNDDMMKLMSKIKTTFNSDRTFGSGSYKEQKLKDWEDKMMKYFKELAPPTWIKKIIDNILKNMVISIKNLNIYYESFSLLSSPSLAKISLQELNLHSTNENWAPGFNSNPKVQFRELFIKGLAVTLNINKKKTFDISGDIPFKKEAVHKAKTSPTAPKASKKPLFHHHSAAPVTPMNRSKHIAFQETDDLEAEYKKLRENDVYLLFPLDLSVRVRTELDLSKDFENDPQKLVLVDVKEAIIFMLNKDHMRFLGALNEHLRLMNIVQKNLHLRPIEPPKRRLKEWWKYAVRAVLEERKRQSDFSKDPGSLWKMKKYIDLYKRQQNIISVPWLPRITEKERPLFKKLEEDIPLQNLVQFREWAFIEIRVEAKRFATLNKDVQGMKPLIDVWFHILNNDDMFKPNSKDSVAETIRLTPLEQTDLYEILALDKAKVLESYLKGENNDPKDISMNLKMNLASFYIMISEPKWSSNPFKRASSVRSWWTQPNLFAGDMSAKLTVDSVMSGSHLRHKNSPKGQSPTFQDFETLPNMSSPKSPYKKNNHVSVKVYDHDNDLSMKSQSFREHLKDIEREVESKYLVNETEDENQIEDEHTEINVAQSYPLLSTWWNQNLILIFEILDINTSMNKYRSGRLSTEGEKPLEFGSIMVTTAFNLPKATKYRKPKASSEGGGLQYDLLLQHILAYDFNSVPSVGQRDANPFIAYLKSSGFVNLASFLEIFEKDKRNSGEVIINNLKAYRPFFNESDPLFIEQLREVRRKFDNYLKFSNAIKETKERIILEAYEEIEQHILKLLLPPFLFSHGILVLPLILQANTFSMKDQEIASTAKNKIDAVFKTLNKTLKNVPNQLNVLSKSFLGKMTKKMASQELTDSPLNLFFDIEGRESKFKIKKIDMPTSKLHSPNLFGKGLVVDMMDEKEQNEGQSFIKLSVQPIILHLSIESLKPLIIFFKSFSQNNHVDVSTSQSEGTDSASVRDYEKMIDCIHYNKDREKEIQADEGPKLEARFSMITIKVSNFIPNYRQERELCFSFRDILYKVKNPNSSELAPSLETKRLQTYYRAKSLRVEEIVLEEVINVGKDSSSINILRAGIIFYFYDCLFKNHPLYTDSKIHALIPFFNLNVDDGALLFLQTIKLANILLSNLSNKNVKEYPKGAREDLIMGTNQRNMLINRFKVLRNDHKESNKACKHCILRFKKSQTVLNLFFGDLGKYCSTLIATPFHNLYSVLEKDSLSKKMDQGLTISLCHSLSNNEEKVQQTLLYIPFLSVTRDRGFFKDNIVIHCTESSKPGREGSGKDSIDFKIKPMIKVTNQFMANLDEKFWRYFKDFEKFYRNKEDKPKFESMVSVEQSNSSSIKSDKMEGEKLFMIEGEGSEQNIEERGLDGRPKVYVLFARKKILLKDLAMQFEIGENDFRNFLVLKLREINISFNSFRSFCCLKNTMDTFSYLNNWFDHFLGSMSITRTELSRAASIKPAESGMTLSTVDNMIETEDIAVLIEKISFLIKIKPPQIVWSFEINRVCFETAKKIQGGTRNELSEEQIWELFSISHINVSLTSSSSGTIRNILLRYHKDLQQIRFSIENVHHSCPSRTDNSLIRIPSSSAVSEEKRALQAYLIFNNGVLSSVNVAIASIGVYVSKILLVEELCGLDVYNTLLLLEKGNLTELLANTVFQKIIFDEIELMMHKSHKEKEIPSHLPTSRGPHIGPFEAEEDAGIIISVENANAKLLTDNHIMFAELNIDQIQYQRDLEGQYEVSCGSFGLHPRNSYYGSFITDMQPSYPMKISLYKNSNGDDYPTLHIQNSKIIYLERVIAEIKAFQRGIQREIEAASQKISQVTVPKPKPDLRNFSRSGLPSRNVLVKLQLENSCVILPRDSRSQDMLIALFEKVDATIESDIRNIDFPEELKKPFTVVNNKLVVDISPEKYAAPCAVTVVKADITKLDLLYINKGLKRAIGSSDSAFIMSTSPKSPLVMNQWNFDAALEANLERFSFSMNAACLIEVDELMTQNLKETSDVFKFRPKDLARTKLFISGRELQLDMNRAIIEASVAEEIRAKRNPPEENDQKEKERGPAKRL